MDKAQLKRFVERIERLEEQKREFAEDITDTYKEAKEAGFDIPTMRSLVKLRRLDKTIRDEALARLDEYCVAIGLA